MHQIYTKLTHCFCDPVTWVIDYICLSVRIIVTQRLDFELQEDHVYISAKRHEKVICGLILTSFIEIIDDAKKKIPGQIEDANISPSVFIGQSPF